MKFFAYIYVNRKVLRTRLNISYKAIESCKSEGLIGEAFLIEAEDLDDAIQSLMTLVKIIYRHYFFHIRYTDLTTDNVLAKSITEVKQLYHEYPTNFT